MPELPEVETIRRGVERLLIGQLIVGGEAPVAKILKPPVTDPDEFVEKLTGCRLTNARRYGKHLIFGLDSGYALYAHLNMRGQVVVARDFGLPPARYLCVAVRFDSGMELRYHDIWTWGELRLFPDRHEDVIKYVPALGTMGPEPLSEQFSGVALAQGSLARSGRPIKTVLLDQSFVAGVGNIYSDEALYRAKISPFRPAKSLTEQDWDRLSKQIVEVISAAVDGGGTFSDNYVDVDGTVGRYHPLVYGRSGQSCMECGERLDGARLGGRSTVFCQKCQQ